MAPLLVVILIYNYINATMPTNSKTTNTISSTITTNLINFGLFSESSSLWSIMSSSN